MSTCVPFFRPHISEPEIMEVVDTLKSGWLTTGPRVRLFEEEFAAAVATDYAVALNSCTAALHLAIEALGLQRGQGVLVPAMTFAATAEVVRYFGGIPILVDCDQLTTNMDLADAERKLTELRAEVPIAGLPRGMDVVGIIPVHVGGMMMDVDAVKAFAARHQLWIVEDAAHAFPAAWRPSADDEWQRCGQQTASVTCFSFYANKTITTGEGGMAVTDRIDLAERMRLMSLHGLSRDAWQRYSGNGVWDYRIQAPGYKYNLTDVAAAIGIHQLRRAESMREARQTAAAEFLERLSDVEELELPSTNPDRIHSWHLFPIRLRLDRLAIDRAAFMEQLAREGVRCSVHWRPLHLHPYYEEVFEWRPHHLPIASQVWPRLISLPLFSSMHPGEIDHVAKAVRKTCRKHRTVRVSAPVRRRA